MVGESKTPQFMQRSIPVESLNSYADIAFMTRLMRNHEAMAALSDVSIKRINDAETKIELELERPAGDRKNLSALIEEFYASCEELVMLQRRGYRRQVTDKIRREFYEEAIEVYARKFLNLKVGGWQRSYFHERNVSSTIGELQLEILDASDALLINMQSVLSRTNLIVGDYALSPIVDAFQPYFRIESLGDIDLGLKFCAECIGLSRNKKIDSIKASIESGRWGSSKFTDPKILSAFKVTGRQSIAESITRAVAKRNSLRKTQNNTQ